MPKGNDRIKLITDANTPTNAEGEKGEIRFDEDNIYICIDDKTWKKTAIVNI